MVARGLGHLAAILAIAGMGCVVMVPERRTTSQIVGTDRSPLIVGRIGGIVVHAELSGSQVGGAQIEVRTTRHRQCHRTVERMVEQRSKRVAKIESGGDVDFKGASAAGILVWIALIPVVFAASSVVTGVVVGLDGTEVARKPQSGGDERFTCPAQATFVRLEIVLPSGALITGTTDALGRATFAIPRAEPAGPVLVRAVGVIDPPPPPPPDPDVLVTDDVPPLPPAIREVVVRYGD